MSAESRNRKSTSKGTLLLGTGHFTETSPCCIEATNLSGILKRNFNKIDLLAAQWVREYFENMISPLLAHSGLAALLRVPFARRLKKGGEGHMAVDAKGRALSLASSTSNRKRPLLRSRKRQGEPVTTSAFLCLRRNRPKSASY